MFKTKEIRHNINFWYILFFLALMFFALSSRTRIDQPVAQDELHWLVAAETFYTDGIPQQFKNPDRILVSDPYLYLWSVVLAFKFFGNSVVVARLPGVVSGLIAIVMVFLITKSFSQGDQVERVQLAALSSLFYALTPAFIQGSTIILIDNTILIPALLFLYWTFMKFQREGIGRWAILTGIAMALALWGRVTTPPIIASLFICYTLVTPRAFKEKLIIISAFLSGTFLFAISWYLYCNATGVPFYGPFTYALNAFLDRAQSSGGLTAAQVSQNLVYLILWIGVFPSFLFLVIMIQKCKDYLRHFEICLEDLFLWGGVILMLGYTLIGGANFGYPKYHSPAIPLLCIFLGIMFSRLKQNIVYDLKVICVILFAFVIQVLIFGDMLYVLRYTVRNNVAFNLSLTPVLKTIAFKIGFSAIAFVMVFIILMKSSFKKGWMMVFILFSIGTNMGTALLQNTANYYTGYNYGGKGTIETVKYLRESVLPQSGILAPSEIVYYMKLPKSSYAPDSLWTNMDEIKNLLVNNTGALVYSTPTNSIQQLRILSNNEIQKILQRDFSQMGIGTYTIWIRKH